MEITLEARISSKYTLSNMKLLFCSKRQFKFVSYGYEGPKNFVGSNIVLESKRTDGIIRILFHVPYVYNLATVFNGIHLKEAHPIQKKKIEHLIDSQYHFEHSSTFLITSQGVEYFVVCVNAIIDDLEEEL
jgi:hypothetical protein